MILLSIINTILVVSLIVFSRWSGWRLALLLALAYYGSAGTVYTTSLKRA